MPAQAVFGFEQDNPVPFGEQPCGREAGNAATDNSDIKGFIERLPALDPFMPFSRCKLSSQSISLRAPNWQYLRNPARDRSPLA
jgi:hypothetical protein